MKSNKTPLEKQYACLTRYCHCTTTFVGAWARNRLQWSAYSGARVRQRVSWIQHQCSTENSILHADRFFGGYSRKTQTFSSLGNSNIANTLNQRCSYHWGKRGSSLSKWKHWTWNETAKDRDTLTDHWVRDSNRALRLRLRCTNRAVIGFI